MENLTELQALAAEGWRVREKHFAPRIEFATPKRTKAISVTGAVCALNCAHCGGHYLEAMQPLSEIRDEKAVDADSCLISGGCTLRGKVPVAEHAEKLGIIKGKRRYGID